jgi:choline dehydrogenase
VIIAASSINSPKLLQLSGIGAPKVLKAAGIELVHAPGRRREPARPSGNLFPDEVQAAGHAEWQLNCFSKGMIGAEWLLFQDGLGATNHFESCGFIRSQRRHRISGYPVSLPARCHAL